MAAEEQRVEQTAAERIDELRQALLNELAGIEAEISRCRTALNEGRFVEARGWYDRVAEAVDELDDGFPELSYLEQPSAATQRDGEEEK